MLRRRGLAGRVKQALERGSILLHAGPGFGKTVALQQGLEAHGGHAAWVHCTETHRDPGRLLDATIAALRAAAPGVADALGERLASGIAPVDVEQATRILANELEALLLDPLVLVFDDAEVLAASEEAARVVAALLGARSEALRIAVATRHPLALRTAKLTAAGRLTVFGAAELAFTAAECAELLRQRTGPAVRDEDVDAVWAATEGWPLAVALAARSGARPPSRVAEPGSLFDYLAEELLAPLPPSLRLPAVESSVAPELDPTLLERLGLPPGLPEELSRHGMPLLRTGTGTRHRVHHPLVREFLLDRIDHAHPEVRRRELHARCAEWLEAAGRGAEAVERWFAAESPARAAATVAVHGPQLARTSPATVAGWLGRLPSEHRRAPELQLLEGRLAAGAGRLDDAVAPLRAAAAGFAERGDELSTWMARVALVDTLTIAEDFAAAVPVAEGYEHAEVPFAPVVAIGSAAALGGAARFADASELFAAAARHPFGAPLATIARAFKGFWVDLPCGELDAALDRLLAAVAELERDDPFDRLPFVLGMLALVHEERGEDAEGLAVMTRSRRAADAAATGGYIADIAHRFAAGVQARAGRLDEAERELEAVGPAGPGWYAADTELTRATIAAARGRRPEAVELCERVIRLSAPEAWRTRWRNAARLVPVLASLGRGERAAELVDATLADRPPLASCARLVALRGWLCSRVGDEARAVDLLLRAWQEAGRAPEHLVRREWPRLESVLWAAVEREALAPAAVTAAVESAFPGGAALLPFTRHPVAAMRAAAVASAAASGHPEAPGRAAELEHDPDPSIAAAARSVRVHLADDPPPLAFTVLGGFALRRGSYAVQDAEWGRRRRAAQRLVRFLLVHRSGAPEDALFAAFWPEAPPASARRSLQVTLSSARAVLDVPGAARSRITTAERTYRLVPDARDTVDADEYEQAARRALAADGPQRPELLAMAAARWSGEPLPEDRYEDWAAEWRERLTDLQRRILATLTHARSEAGDPGAAVEAARRLVELDRLDEGAHRTLMLAYARAGRRGHALRQYLACRRALIGELGLEPGAETTALQHRILAGEAV